MARELIPYFNASTYGQGLEGVANYANSIVNNFMVPLFLLVIYFASIYVWSKSDYKLGGGIFYISLIMFVIAIVAQTFTVFAQLVIFIFFVGIIVGIVMYFLEG